MVEVVQQETCRQSVRNKEEDSREEEDSVKKKTQSRRRRQLRRDDEDLKYFNRPLPERRVVDKIIDPYG
jgi:hypothetical protein